MAVDIRRCSSAFIRRLFFGAVFCLHATLCRGQNAETLIPETPVSMGQPQRVRFNWAALGGYDWERDRATGRLLLDMTGTGRLAAFGIGEQTIEASAGARGSEFEAAFGFHIKIPVISVGAEYTLLDEKVVTVLSASFTPRRGGIFHDGEHLRIDYHPTERELLVGLTFNWPINDYRPTRPLKTYASVPKGKVPEPSRGVTSQERAQLAEALGRIDHAIAWMDRLLTPRFDTGGDFQRSAQAYREHIRTPGHSFAEEDSTYHAELAAAFTAASGDERVGRELALQAESIIFNDVVVPFNNLFGWNKKPHDAAGLAEAALRKFERLLAEQSIGRSESDLHRRAMMAGVMRSVLNSINRVSKAGRDRWRQSHLFWLEDSRLVWLPLNYGLRPDRYDSQEEWDAIMATVTGERFSEANTIRYLLNNAFHLEVKKMIRDTRFYHVMIIHDFQGWRGRTTDAIGWDVVTDGYIRAFSEAVDAIDAGVRTSLPQFMLFLDENYYDANRARQIITFLENLYEDDDVELKDKDIEEQVRSARSQLKEKINASKTFGALSDEECRELFKVHVNITNPYDPVFQWDVGMRDHRKLAFRDVFEDRPDLGSAVLGGQGIGESYVGKSWEDRSVAIRGPALVQLKTAARRLFLSQGFDEDQVPKYLRAKPHPDDFAERCARLENNGWRAPMMLTVNMTGYGDKRCTVLKAAMYNLMPAGAVLYSTDSLWISDFWAGMFIAAALRGGRLYPIGASPANAPSSLAPTMYLMREALGMMVSAREFFAQDIRASGGALRVGLYSQNFPVNDIGARVRGFLDALDRYPFITEDFQIHPSVLGTLREANAKLADQTKNLVVAPLSPDQLETSHRPFVHLKAQFMGSARAFDIIGREEWAPVLEEYFRMRQMEVRGIECEGITPQLLHTRRSNTDPDVLEAFDRYLTTLPPGERNAVLFMMTIGSQNQDRRGMLLDGEVLLAVSGYDCLVGLTDFLLMLGSSSWPPTTEEFSKVFPEQKGPSFLRRAYKAIQDLI
jgi:hypothetical protein